MWQLLASQVTDISSPQMSIHVKLFAKYPTHMLLVTVCTFYIVHESALAILHLHYESLHRWLQYLHKIAARLVLFGLFVLIVFVHFGPMTRNPALLRGTVLEQARRMSLTYSLIEGSSSPPSDSLIFLG